MTNNPLVSFLASYGPQPSSNNLYDEFVVEAAKRTGCEPLHIEQPLVGNLKGLMLGDHPRSVILTGTAGDGKTYTARKLLEALDIGTVGWTNTQKYLTLDLPSQPHRKVTFIKDLSELNKADKDSVFASIRDSLLGRTDELFVICVNDGHLLRFFKDRQDRDEGLGDLIAESLRKGKSDSGDEVYRLHNMSRQSHHELVEDILDAIVEHPDWRQCEGCPAFTSVENPCPIRCNLRILQERGDATMRARLRDLIRMAAADGRHVSIRQLILLVVNILLGDEKSPGKLLTCKKARNRASKKAYALTNPYANAFGNNLRIRQRRQYWVFAVLEEFGIGFETNNYFDHSILNDCSELPNREQYGTELLGEDWERYLNDTSTYDSAFERKVVDQRRRLFFSIEPASTGNRQETSPWNLTLFRHGDDYIKLANSCANEDIPLPPRIRRKLLRGLNRMMTGELAKTCDRIWLTEPSGVFRGQGMPLLVAEVGDRRHTLSFFSMPIVASDGSPPILRITPSGNPKRNVDLHLWPTLVECLLRVAEGALPASFSSECLQAITRFQLQVTAAIDREFLSSSVPRQIALDSIGNLVDHEIGILGQTGKW